MDDTNTGSNNAEPLDFNIVDKVDDEQRVVDLWNSGGELVQAGRYGDALPLWEQAIALEEAIGHPDLQQDREQLNRLREIIALPPDELQAAQEAMSQADAVIESQLAQLPPELRTGVEQQLREFLAMPLQEQESILSQMEDMMTQTEETVPVEAEIDVDPNDKPAYLAALWNRGNALIDTGRVAEALPYWQQAVEIATELNHPQLPLAQQALDYLHSALYLAAEDAPEEYHKEEQE